MQNANLASQGRIIGIGHDAFGNILVTGDRHDVRVSVIIADRRLFAGLHTLSDRKELEIPIEASILFTRQIVVGFLGGKS